MSWFSDTLGGVGDAIGGAVDAVGGALKSAGDVLNDTQKYLVSTTQHGIENTLRDAPKWAGDAVQTMANMDFGIPVNAISNWAQDPTDIHSYTDPIKDEYNTWDDYQNRVWGTGGWKKAGMNFISTGNPFYGAGDVVYGINSAVNNEPYTNGYASGPKSLMGMYNLGSNLYNGLSSSTPSVDTSGASNTVDENMNPQIPSYQYDPTYDASSVNGDFGSYQNPVAQDSLLNYGGTAGSYSPLLGTSTSNPGYDFSSLNNAYNSVKQFGNTNTGRLASTALGFAGPTGAAIGAGLQGVSTGDWSPFVKTLGQMYLTNRAKANNQAYLNDLHNRVGQIDQQYSLNGDIAKGIEERLNRQAAMSGRRSQYGAIQTQLGAQLAQLRAQQEAPILNALGSQTAFNARAAQTDAEKSRVGTLLQLFDQYNNMNKNQNNQSTPTVSMPSGGGLKMPDLNSIWSLT
ncbi:MAG TPA: hypothetical protein VFM18_21405 [Methanosarcina sp.]|nr:hypothetical protein [Methanosarcina sp.]